MKKYPSILLVDDDEVSTFLHKRIFDKLELAEHMQVARNGLEALEYVQHHCFETEDAGCPSLIFLDIHMPVMDGFEFLAEYESKTGRHTPAARIFLLTSSSNPVDVEEAKKYRVAGYINKPLTQEKLAQSLRSLPPFGNAPSQVA